MLPAIKRILSIHIFSTLKNNKTIKERLTIANDFHKVTRRILKICQKSVFKKKKKNYNILFNTSFFSVEKPKVVSTFIYFVYFKIKFSVPLLLLSLLLKVDLKCLNTSLRLAVQLRHTHGTILDLKWVVTKSGSLTNLPIIFH